MWTEAPSFEEVRDALRKRAELRVARRIAELELERAMARVSKVKARDKAVRLIGYDEESNRALTALYDQLAEIQAQLDIVDSAIDFHEYHKEMFKSMAYKTKGL